MSTVPGNAFSHIYHHSGESVLLNPFLTWWKEVMRTQTSCMKSSASLLLVACTVLKFP